MITSPVVLALASMVAQATTITASSEMPWTVYEEVQVPAMTANHVVGGLGFGVAFERGVFGLNAEAQLLPVVVCDDSCGPAYAGGIGISATPGRWRDVSGHFALMAEYFAHPSLHQYVPAISPRAGVRWLSGGTGVSLDVGLSFAAADTFDTSGFAHNKVFSWAMPEMVMAFWF
jgi:hypothetical protein